MKKRLSILLLLPLIVFIGFIGCEGPEGPAGPAGANGDQGENGADGALLCLNCHDDAGMAQKEAEFALAGHSEAYTRFNSGSCAVCHSHEGFVANGDQAGLEDAFVHGSTMSCGTCHSHSTNGEGKVFSADVPLRFNDPVVMLTGVDDIDLGGESNLCVRCHQPRTTWDAYDDETGDFAFITSSHAGPHHGAQSTALMGLGGDHRLSSSLDDYGPSPHGAEGCVSCHMNEGNHSFKPVAAACTGCHEVDGDLDHGDARAAIATKMATLAGYLTATEGHAIERDSLGVYVVIPDSMVHGPLHMDDAGEYHPVIGAFDRDVYSAFWNYMTVVEDQSGGAHNPPYMEALLNASMDVFE